MPLAVGRSAQPLPELHLDAVGISGLDGHVTPILHRRGCGRPHRRAEHHARAEIRPDDLPYPIERLACECLVELRIVGVRVIRQQDLDVLGVVPACAVQLQFADELARLQAPYLAGRAQAHKGVRGEPGQGSGDHHNVHARFLRQSECARHAAKGFIQRFISGVFFGE